MSNELSFSASFKYTGLTVNLDGLDFELVAQRLSVSGTPYVRGTLTTATTSATAIPLGGVSSCGWAVFKNLSANAFTIRAGSGGTAVLTIPAGFGYPIYLATNTPYAACASASSSSLEFLILSQ